VGLVLLLLQAGGLCSLLLLLLQADGLCSLLLLLLLRQVGSLRSLLLLLLIAWSFTGGPFRADWLTVHCLQNRQW
jgi:hypothetical protein